MKSQEEAVRQLGVVLLTAYRYSVPPDHLNRDRRKGKHKLRPRWAAVRIKETAFLYDSSTMGCRQEIYWHHTDGRRHTTHRRTITAKGLANFMVTSLTKYSKLSPGDILLKSAYYRRLKDADLQTVDDVSQIREDLVEMGWMVNKLNVRKVKAALVAKYLDK